MSTVYNPLSSGENLLSSFGGGGSLLPSNDTSGGESAPSALGFAPGGALDMLSSALGNGIPLPGVSALPGSGSVFGLSVSRVVAIVLGLLLIGGGIIMFRPEVITEAAKGAALG